MSEKLLPCKRCGYKFGRKVHYMDGGYKYTCPKCSYSTESKPTVEEAMAAWNQRRKTEPLIK